MACGEWVGSESGACVPGFALQMFSYELVSDFFCSFGQYFFHVTQPFVHGWHQRRVTDVRVMTLRNLSCL